MRFVILSVVFAGFTVSGCTGVDPATAEAQDRAYCYNLGAQGDKLVDCMMYRDNARRQAGYQRSAAIARAGNALVQYSQQQQMLNAMNQPRTTICHTASTAIHCNTF